MKLTDIAPLERWIELEQEIHTCTGMDANVFDARGYRIKIGRASCRERVLIQV